MSDDSGLSNSWKEGKEEVLKTDPLLQLNGNKPLLEWNKNNPLAITPGI